MRTTNRGADAADRELARSLDADEGGHHAQDDFSRSRVHDSTTGADQTLPSDIATDNGRTAHGSWTIGADGTATFTLDGSAEVTAGTIVPLDDYWDCVSKSGWGGAAGGAAGGCVVTSEVGCVEGGAAGGLTGGVAGLVGGLITCS